MLNWLFSESERKKNEDEYNSRENNLLCKNKKFMRIMAREVIILWRQWLLFHRVRNIVILGLNSYT